MSEEYKRYAKKISSLSALDQFRKLYGKAETKGKGAAIAKLIKNLGLELEDRVTDETYNTETLLNITKNIHKHLNQNKMEFTPKFLTASQKAQAAKSFTNEVEGGSEYPFIKMSEEGGECFTATLMGMVEVPSTKGKKQIVALLKQGDEMFYSPAHVSLINKLKKLNEGDKVYIENLGKVVETPNGVAFEYVVKTVGTAPAPEAKREQLKGGFKKKDSKPANNQPQDDDVDLPF